MNAHDHLMVIVDAAKGFSLEQAETYGFAFRPGTTDRMTLDECRAERAAWLEVRRLAEAVPEMVKLIEESQEILYWQWKANKTDRLDAMRRRFNDLLAKLRTPNPEQFDPHDPAIVKAVADICLKRSGSLD